MDTEGHWSMPKIPGYAGFVPGMKDIYGRSYGRMPPLKTSKERRNDTKENVSEDYKAKDMWQVFLPPVKYIPGYTGHLPGKSYVFGKTFTQQVDECFNILAKTKKVPEERRRNFEESSEMNRSSTLDKRRNTLQTSRSDDPLTNKTTRSPFTTHKSNISPLSTQSFSDVQYQPTQKDESTQVYSSKSSNKYNKESMKLRTETPNSKYIPHMDNQQFNEVERMQNGNFYSDPVTTKSKYEISSKNTKYDTQNDSRFENNCELKATSQFNQSRREFESSTPENRQNYSYNSYSKDVTYQSSDPRMQLDSTNSMRKSDSRMQLDSTNSMRNNEYVQTHPENKNYPDVSSNNTERQHCNCNCCQSYPVQVKKNDANVYYDKKEQMYDNRRQNDSQYATQNYHYNRINRNKYDLEKGYEETHPSSEQINRSKYNLEFTNSTKQNEDIINERKLHSSKSDNPRNKLENLKHETLPTTAHREGNAQEQLSVDDTNRVFSNHYLHSFESNQGNLEKPNRNVMWQDDRNHSRKPRKEQDINNSQKYFNTSLNPPITGYSGYIPRLNSSSALGMPFGAHISRNVRR